MPGRTARTRKGTDCALPWSVLQKEKPSSLLPHKPETSLWGLSPVTGWPDSHGSVEIENTWDCCSCQATTSYTLTWPSQEGCLMQSEILGIWNWEMMKKKKQHRDVNSSSDLLCDLGQVPVLFGDSVSYPLYQAQSDCLSCNMNRHQMVRIKVGWNQRLRS